MVLAEWEVATGVDSARKSVGTDNGGSETRRMGAGAGERASKGKEPSVIVGCTDSGETGREVEPCEGAVSTTIGIGATEPEILGDR